MTADFREVLLQLVEDPTVALHNLRCAADVKRWTLYGARHGEVMHLLMSGVAVEIVAESCRIPVNTLLRHYRRHNLADDTLERNGAFADIHNRVVLARAREEGFLATAASMEMLVRRVQQLDNAHSAPRSMSDLLLLPRPRLWALLAPVVAVDASTTAAAAALLRSAWVSRGLCDDPMWTEDEDVCLIGEDDVLSQADMLAFVARAEAAEQQRRVDRLSSLANHWGVEQPALLGASEAPVLQSSAHPRVAAAGAVQVVSPKSPGALCVCSEDGDETDEEEEEVCELPIALRGLRARTRPSEVVQLTPLSSARVERARQAERGLFGYEGGGEEEDGAIAGPGVNALFARADLGTTALPTLGLAIVVDGDGAVQPTSLTDVISRIEVQEQVTGRSISALRKDASVVVKWDYYLQALSAGHAGVLQEGHLQVLRRRWSLIGHGFKDMVRVHGEGSSARLAFPRCGVQQMLFEILTAGDVHAVLVAVDLETLGGVPWQRAARLAALALDDERLVAGGKVLRPRFETLVRSLHTDGGMFASGLSEEVLARGCAQLHVSSCFVRECVRIFGLTNLGIVRLEKATSHEAVIGWRKDGARSSEPSGVGLMRRVRPYGARTITTYR